MNQEEEKIIKIEKASDTAVRLTKTTDHVEEISDIKKKIEGVDKAIAVEAARHERDMSRLQGDKAVLESIITEASKLNIK